MRPFLNPRPFLNLHPIQFSSLTPDLPPPRYPCAPLQAASAKDPSGLCIVAHLSPSHMVSSPRYQAWAASLGPQWQHLLCSQGAQAVTLRRATALQVSVLKEEHTLPCAVLTVK